MKVVVRGLLIELAVFMNFSVQSTNANPLAEKNLILGNIAVAEKDLIKAKQFYKTALDNSDKKSQYELWELASMKYANVNFAS